MKKLTQLLLLIWKNFKLQVRHPWVTLFEIGIPTFFTILLVLVRINVKSEYVVGVTLYESFPLSASYNNWQLLFVPQSDLSESIIQSAAQKLRITSWKGFDDEGQMLQYYANSSAELTTFAGVVFENLYSNSTALPKKLSYKIRLKALTGQMQMSTNGDWKTKYSFPVIQTLEPRAKNDSWGGVPGYMERGFLPIQHAVDMSLIESLSNNSVYDFQFDMQRYPYPPYDDDQFLTYLQFFFPLVIMFSFVYPCLNIVKNLVSEKEKKLTHAMKMMGLSNWMHWTAWYIKYILFLSLSVVIITMILTVKFQDIRSVLIKSDPTVVFFILLIYTSSTICFCFFISVLFSKANSAAAGAGIIFFLSLVPYLFIYPRYDDLSVSEKMASCTLLNTALALATVILATWESTGAGLQWSLLSERPTPDDNLTMSMVLWMMIIDSALYLLLTWYIEAVFPGEYGVPEPWYFPFTRSYWCGTQQDFKELTKLYNSSEKNWEFFENEPTNLMAGIQMHGLTKVYHKKKAPAVNNLSANMYRGQISVLLGHNGAGKTTTISMLTGLYPPTSGTAIVNGYDIRDDIEAVHSSLGICPQHNVLFDDLTVEEHLLFFCKLKGYLTDLVTLEVDRMVSALGLEDKKKAKAKTLSGGMKRKLSVGIALVGGSRIVMLDEPTSGMDPSARRFTWDLLQAEKEDRTILLTTHFMEEADILGDRIAIMAEGEIQCCGSPLFLKKKYGAGYHLVMVKDKLCDITQVTELVHSYIPAAEISKNIGAELTYILPHENSPQFQHLFAEIETKKEALHISSFGACITTMEEVFIKVGERSSMNELLAASVEKSIRPVSPMTDSGAHDLGSIPSSSTSTVSVVELVHDNQRNDVLVAFNQKLRVQVQQLQALLRKRMLYSYRNWALTLSQLLLPPFFLVLTLVVLKTMPKPDDSPALKLSLHPFDKTNVAFQTLTNESDIMDMANTYARQFNDSLLVNVDNVKYKTLTDYFVDQGKANIRNYNMHNIISMSIGHIDGATKIKTWFNNQAYHSPAISLMYTSNMLLKYFVNDNYSLSVTNYPFPRTIGEQGEQLQFQPTESYEVAQDIMFGMSFLVASFAVFLVKEKSTKSKHLQRVSGVNLFSFWLATFVWDFICYMLSTFLVLLVFRCFDTPGMTTVSEQGRVLLLFIVHGFSALMFVYVLSFLFQLSSTAYVCICLCNILSGIGTVLTVTVMGIPQLGLHEVAETLNWLFTITLPNYCLGRSVGNLYQNFQFKNICSLVSIQCLMPEPLLKQCCPEKCDDDCFWVENFFSWTNPGIGKQLVFLSIQAVAFLIILCALELKLFRMVKYLMRRRWKAEIQPQDGNDLVAEEDNDVVAERARILCTPLNNLCMNNRLVLKTVRKLYGSLVSVDDLSFGVQKGECFGLLGLNGAGKTTTFKMITGECSMTSGDIYLDGYNVRTSLRKVQQRLGYCPQFDALIDQLTGRETLVMYARLRGMSESSILPQITHLSSMLSFKSHINKQVKEYSGGNRRKLSVAIALIGNPPMIFLDEPTTGMDPVSRHNIWDVLLQVLRAGQSIVLTSHSMEECEALCSKLVIMVNGKLCCIGSPQHLKSKFGRGFTLLVKVDAEGQKNMHMQNLAGSISDQVSFMPCQQPICNRAANYEDALRNNVQNVKIFIEEAFPGSILKDIHEGYLHYHIPKSGLSWSQIFGTIEKAKTALHIRDYSIGQTTLEQVFLNFARSQREQND